jgi:hypothetical protein
VNEQSYDFIFIHNRYSAFSNPDVFQGKKAYLHHLSGYFLFSCKLLCIDSIYLAYFKISDTYHYFFYALQLSVLPHRTHALLVYPECSDRQSPPEKKGSGTPVAYGDLFNSQSAVFIPSKFI